MARGRLTSPPTRSTFRLGAVTPEGVGGAGTPPRSPPGIPPDCPPNTPPRTPPAPASGVPPTLKSGVVTSTDLRSALVSFGIALGAASFPWTKKDFRFADAIR